jgi:20S proteasome alpha/beta subunit
MECVLGVVGRDFAVVAADTSAVQSILVHKTDEDKVMVLDSHKLMGASGEPGDRYVLYSRRSVRSAASPSITRSLFLGFFWGARSDPDLAGFLWVF